jgi:hypothetical protein
MIQCPHCGTLMPESAQFCPGCGTPRTAVRERLQKQAAETGVPYEELLQRERERIRQAQADTWAYPTAPPYPPPAKSNRVWWIVGIVAGGFLLVCVICAAIGLIAYQRAGVSIGEGDAGIAAREQLLLGARGQWGAQWDMLHPAHQQVVSREQFIDCGRVVDLSEVRILLEFNEDHDVPRIGNIETRVVTYSAVRNGESIAEAVRMVLDGGEWRWVMGGTELSVYQSARCP